MTWRHDVVCCSGVTEYNRAGTLQWSMSGMFLAKMLQYFILLFFGFLRYRCRGNPKWQWHWFWQWNYFRPVWYNRAIRKNTACLDCTLDNSKNLSNKVRTEMDVDTMMSNSPNLDGTWHVITLPTTSPEYALVTCYYAENIVVIDAECFLCFFFATYQLPHWYTILNNCIILTLVTSLVSMWCLPQQELKNRAWYLNDFGIFCVHSPQLGH
jgi:hypothetical protein